MFNETLIHALARRIAAGQLKLEQTPPPFHEAIQDVLDEMQKVADEQAAAEAEREAAQQEKEKEATDEEVVEEEAKKEDVPEEAPEEEPVKEIPKEEDQ